MQFHVDRYVGISLSGGKNEKTGIAVLEHYREQKKLFLHSVTETTLLNGETGKRSLDSHLHEFLKNLSPGLRKVGWDVPLTLPVCFNCKLECPGFEDCGEPNIEWMWKAFERQKRKRAQARVFTPYTQRA
ncbi:MAG: DUF429 domain-containing protein, partial [Bdellovibrionales bacterium]|nr:DUF429 domain-containing protein [Bdellovibrionales bacterium]